jgi:hypothetical protein
MCFSGPPGSRGFNGVASRPAWTLARPGSVVKNRPLPRGSAGELTIDVGRADDYRRVEASVWAGEVRATPFGRRAGGLFRSVDWEGPGQYRLEAHLKAGEIRLR